MAVAVFVVLAIIIAIARITILAILSTKFWFGCSGGGGVLMMSTGCSATTMTAAIRSKVIGIHFLLLVILINTDVVVIIDYITIRILGS